MDAHLAEWMSLIDTEIDATANAISVETAGTSVCRVHKDGRVTGGLKYEEGRLVALTEAKRLTRGDADIDDGLARLVEHWAGELDHRRSVPTSSMPWIAYATGGFEAAELAAAAFRREA